MVCLTAKQQRGLDCRNMARIASRAEGLWRSQGVGFDRTSCIMDLDCVHFGSCPLDLDRLCDASDADLAHDVAGINKHLDRMTGELKDGFVPRYAARA